MTSLADDWELCLTGDLRKFGQVVLLCEIRSRAAGVRQYAILTSLDGTRIVRTFMATANPFRLLRGLIGTASGPIASDPWRACFCERFFSVGEMHWRSGHARGFSAGFAFGYTDLTLVAVGLFSVRTSGFTASMMFPSVGTLEGRWYLVDGRPDEAPFFDAPADWEEGTAGVA